MRKLFGLLAAALLSTTVALTSYAADEAKKGTADQATTAAAAGSMMGEHDMTGTIDRIDHKSGVIKLSAKPHDLELHFTPDTIKELKKGDKITVHMGFQKD